MLHTILTDPVPEQPPLLIAHGLYGSARNWSTIARRLSDSRQVLTVDMRNHGASFFHACNDYPDLAGDLAEVITVHGGPMDVLGHSMGGKAAMMLALTKPELVNRLIVGDIAPVAYEHTQLRHIQAMRQVDLGKLTTRRDADSAMKPGVPEDDIRAFLIQSIDVKEKKWRLNLDALEAEMPRII
ncbi:MAG: alpha/beta fold hydrolase, partial [Pseudomonadota bacterium]